MELTALRKLAVVGCGTMGRGIVQVAASHGLAVLFVERDEAAVRAACEGLDQSMAREIERWSLTESERRAILARTEGTADMARLAECDVAIEAVDEHPATKHRVVAEIDAALPAGAPILSNTSTMSITELAARTGRPALVAGTHFLHPAQRRPLVEVVRGLHTSDDTVAFAFRLLGLLEKTGVEVFEYPGYITTRLIVPYLNEAMHLVLEGIATADAVDTAMRLGFDFPAGPLTMADRFGLDEVLAWMEQLFRDLGDVKYRPCPLLRKMVRGGRLGVKSGEGFFRYDAQGRRIEATDAR